MQVSLHRGSRFASLAVLLVGSLLSNPFLGITRAYTPIDFDVSIEADLVVNESLFWSSDKRAEVQSSFESVTTSGIDIAQSIVPTETIDQIVTAVNVDSEDLEEAPSPESEITPTEAPIRTTQIASVTVQTKDLVWDVVEEVPPMEIVADNSGEVISLINTYSAQYGVDPDRMIAIAQCESGLRSDAVSPSGAYVGLFQFVASTWVSNRNAMGLDSAPSLRAHAEEAIRTAAFKMSRDGYGAWPECGRA